MPESGLRSAVTRTRANARLLRQKQGQCSTSICAESQKRERERERQHMCDRSVHCAVRAQRGSGGEVDKDEGDDETESKII